MFAVDSFVHFSVPISDIKIEKKSIIRLLGYDSQHIEPYINEIINKRINEAYTLIDGKGGYIIKEILSLQSKEGVMVIGNTGFQIGRIIGVQLRKSEYVVFFVATIGKDLELLSESLFKQGEMLDGYIVNLIASEAAESCAEFVHNYIKELALTKGLKITNRYSPGYCNWTVAEQFKLFSFFPDTFNDVKLTDSALMNPMKSVSGLIGIGEHSIFHQYTCSICNDENCIYRNKKTIV